MRINTVFWAIVFLLWNFSMTGNTVFEYKFDKTENKTVKNSAGEKYHGTFSGDLQTETIDNRSVLCFKNKNSAITVNDSAELHLDKGGTICATVKLSPDGHKQNEQSNDMFIFKDREYLLGCRDQRIYFNFHDGEKWAGNIYASPDSKLIPGQWHHVAATLKYHNEVSQGDVWALVSIYLDGKCIASQKFPYAKLSTNASPLKIGTAWDPKIWTLNGEMASASMYDAPLSASEIEEMVLSEAMVKPAFEPEMKLSKTMKAKINDLTSLAEAKAQGENRDTALALIGNLEGIGLVSPAGLDWNAAALKLENILASANTAKTMLEMWNAAGIGSVLTANDTALGFLHDKNNKAFYLINLRDLKTSREMIVAKSPLWTLNFTGKGKTWSVACFSKNLTVTEVQIPEKKAAAWHFTVTWRHDAIPEEPADFTVTSSFKFQNGRLEYDLSVKNPDKDIILEGLTFPDIRLRKLDKGTDILLCPQMSGVEYPKPIENNIVYNANYPTGRGSMQLGAYYDDKSGIYFAIHDPKARPKVMNFAPIRSNLQINYNWRIGYEGNGGNSFTSGCPAVVEVLRGNWYDAGLIYRAWLEKYAPWWTEKLPRQDTPEWFRNMTLWVMGHGTGVNNLDSSFKTLHNFMELPVGMHWYVWSGQFDRDYPHFNVSAEAEKCFEALRKHDVYVMPYVNGRLWETKDRDEEDWQYSSVGKALAVKDKKGEPVIEKYSGAEFGVMCPAAKGWQKVQTELYEKLAGYGFNGIYVDQTAAAKAVQCYDPQHGHTLGSEDAWVEKGYWQIMDKSRKIFKEKYPNAILTSEDHAEPYVKGFDGVLPWRWMYDGQVPLFPLLYSGRVQFIGRDFGRADSAAKYCMIAGQLINGEQLGWMGVGMLTAPGNIKFSRFVRDMAHLRLGMIRFFNEGMMDRPVKFIKPPKTVTSVWGTHGSKDITTPVIMSSAWKADGIGAFLLVNTSSEVQEQEVEIDTAERGFPNEAVQLLAFNSEGKEVVKNHEKRFSYKVRMAPYSAQVLLLTAEKNPKSPAYIKSIEDAFSRISIFAKKAEPPFIPKPTAPSASGNWHEAVKSAELFGCSISQKLNAVGWCSSGSAIYCGSIDFGNKPPVAFEAELAVHPDNKHGLLEFVVDDLQKGEVIASIEKLEDTGGYDKFKIFSLPIKNKMTGIHYLFIRFNNSSSACNIKKWRTVSGD